MNRPIDMKIDLIYEDLDCTTPFIVRIRTDNQADAINTRISRGKSLCFLIVYAHGGGKFGRKTAIFFK